MSTTSNPSSGSDAVGSHLTVEDAGSTTDAADLFHNDTTAGGSAASDRGASTSEEGRSASADAVAVGGAGRTEAHRSSDAPAAVPASQVTRSASDVPSDPGAPSAPGAPEAPGAPSGRGAPVDDFAIGHVFDQTNGIIDDLDGDSDGTADSDSFSGAERADENPAFEAHTETEPQSQGGVDDTRTTGS
jgi:hypothetical protein